jgi:hypothetical protein
MPMQESLDDRRLHALSGESLARCVAEVCGEVRVCLEKQIPIQHAEPAQA